jgi:hypothetical protein
MGGNWGSGAAIPTGLPVWPAPCGYDSLWKAALASGVPANAVANIDYSDSSAPFCVFKVPGHPELDREIGGADCRAAKPRAR